jgi:hypothetical protein
MKIKYITCLLLIFFIGCQSTKTKNKNIGLTKTVKEEPASKYDGKHEIIEYYRNANLILRIVKRYRINKNDVWMTEQTIYDNGKKVLKFQNTDFSSWPEERKKGLNPTFDCFFSNWEDSDKEVSVSLDKLTGFYKYISIHNPKTLYLYDAFEFKNELIVPFPDLKLRKANKVWEGVTDIFSDLPETIKTQKFDKKKLKKKLKKIEEIKDMK